MCQSQGFISFPLFVGWEQLQRGGEFFKVLRVNCTTSVEVTSEVGLKPTSRSYSSGPARGNKIEGSASIPGASFVEGGTAACSVSGRSMALWVDT